MPPQPNKPRILKCVYWWNSPYMNSLITIVTIQAYATQLWFTHLISNLQQLYIVLCMTFKPCSWGCHPEYHGLCDWCYNNTSHLTTKPTKWHVRPVKTQRLRCPHSRKLGSLATHWAHSEDSDQTGRMPFCWFCHEAAHTIRTDILKIKHNMTKPNIWPT